MTDLRQKALKARAEQKWQQNEEKERENARVSEMTLIKFMQMFDAKPDEVDGYIARCGGYSFWRGEDGQGAYFLLQGYSKTSRERIRSLADLGAVIERTGDQ